MISTSSLAESLADDVRNIQKSKQPQALRCVLNGQPRSLAIELSPQIAVAYDTWHGGISTLWKPAEAGKAVELTGAVFTGAHGPQPKTNGTLIFENKSPKNGQRYHHSDSSATLHYLGHRIEKNGVVTLSFAFRNAEGKHLAVIEDSCRSTEKGQLQRHLKVSELAPGNHIVVDFPSGLEWSGVSDNALRVTRNGSSSHSTSIN
ncbi:hypothetical protein JIN77_05255 [Verrucomicrobiaceae bacterium R5-34]|nr:hypothetical protein [Verrucomicrobiaceae bacterium R5-34]